MDLLRFMKVSELCKMIEDSIHSGRYPFDQDTEKRMAGLAQIINRSSSDNLKDNDIKVEVRINDLYVLNNYNQSIQHLPGVIEIDALDSFKMLCRRIGRIEKSNISFK
jgi:hypothetical protein